MPAALTYPGVYIEELPSGVHTIVGVATSNTAFIDWFPKGPVLTATRVTSWLDFVRQFGGLHQGSEASYAIQQYYRNGGQIAWVIRVTSVDASGASTATAASLQLAGSFLVSASSPGAWAASNLQVQVAIPPSTANLFNLRVRLMAPGARPAAAPVASESFLNLSTDPQSADYAPAKVNARSNLVRLAAPATGTAQPPPATPAQPGWQPLTGGADGDVPGAPGSAWATSGSGALLSALEPVGTSPPPTPLDRIAPEIFNILCIPAAAGLGADSAGKIYSAALAYCRDRRAFLIADVPAGLQRSAVSGWVDTHLREDPSGNAAVYFPPTLIVADELASLRDREVGTSGTVAGIYARTDTNRGVWKAPAGIEAGLVSARLTEYLVDNEIGEINPEGINALRAFPAIGSVVWGARTVRGSDQLADQWKYIPIRRLALFLEESLYQGSRWVVIEPNDEPLWAAIRLNLGAFMHHLFVQGAFQGQTPKEAYFVKCDAQTTTQEDRDLGIVNILVGFAPLKPAEFVVIQIQQIAGAIQT
jgi:phage tail sheath protein FI